MLYEVITSADPRLLPFLAQGPLPARRPPAQLRQAVPARLPGDPRLGQEGAGAGAAGGDRPQDLGKVSRSPHPSHRHHPLIPVTGCQEAVV